MTTLILSSNDINKYIPKQFKWLKTTLNNFLQKDVKYIYTIKYYKDEDSNEHTIGIYTEYNLVPSITTVEFSFNTKMTNTTAKKWILKQLDNRQEEVSDSKDYYSGELFKRIYESRYRFPNNHWTHDPWRIIGTIDNAQDDIETIIKYLQSE